MNVDDTREMLHNTAQLLETLNEANERLQSEVYRLRQARDLVAALLERATEGARLAEERDTARKELEANERLRSEVYRLRQLHAEAVTRLAIAEAGAPGVTVEAAAKLAEERDEARALLARELRLRKENERERIADVARLTRQVEELETRLQAERDLRSAQARDLVAARLDGPRTIHIYGHARIEVTE